MPRRLMEKKMINLQKAEFKNTPKIKVKKMMQHASPFCWNFIAATQNDTQYFVWPPFACMHAWQRRGMLLMRRRMVSWGIFSQI